MIETETSVPNESYEIERGTGTINAFRIQETEESTISAFHLPDSKNEFSSGFFLERPGPDTERSMQKKRIPEGVYKLHANNGSRYQGSRDYIRMMKELEDNLICEQF